jgi:hypothetical protein
MRTSHLTYLDLVVRCLMYHARGVVVVGPLVLHSASPHITRRHCTELLAMLTSGGVITHSIHSQSASANIVVPSEEIRCGYNINKHVPCRESVRVSSRLPYYVISKCQPGSISASTRTLLRRSRLPHDLGLLVIFI